MEKDPMCRFNQKRDPPHTHHFNMEMIYLGEYMFSKSLDGHQYRLQ